MKCQVTLLIFYNLPPHLMLLSPLGPSTLREVECVKLLPSQDFTLLFPHCLACQRASPHFRSDLLKHNTAERASAATGIKIAHPNHSMGFLGDSDGKEIACNAGDLGWIPGLGRSPGRGNGNPLQNSCPETLMDRGGWRATVPRVAQSRRQLR